MSFEKYQNLEYKNRGRDASGVDCWGLLRIIFLEMRGITLSPHNGYTDSEDDAQAEKEVVSESVAHWKPVKDPKQYDAVVFNLAGRPCHIGMMINDSQFIHALKGRGVTIERISNMLWANRVQAYYRYSQ